MNDVELALVLDMSTKGPAMRHVEDPHALKAHLFLIQGSTQLAVNAASLTNKVWPCLDPHLFHYFVMR